MRSSLIAALLLLTALPASPQQAPVQAAGWERPLQPLLEKRCLECHDSETRKGGLDLEKAGIDLSKKDTFGLWLKVHDRIRDGEMPPPKKGVLATEEKNALLATLGKELSVVDLARQRRDGRAELRRMNRIEFENTLRDLLGLSGLRIKELLPEDGKAHGFDRLSQALDISFVHVESYLAAVDVALNEALCPFPAKPPVFTYRYRPWERTRHGGKECEGWLGMSVGQRTVLGLIGMKRDENFRAESSFNVIDDEPLSTAAAIFRNEDGDFRCSLGTIHPVLSGLHKLRASAYSVAWDGKDIVPTERHGALSWGVFSRNEHYGTVEVPPNQAAVVEVSAWLERGGGNTHGLDDSLRIIPSSVEKIRDFRVDKDVTKGPPVPAPGLAIEWLEIEGPLYDQWPPAAHRTLFGELPVKEWTKESGVPKPRQQKWPQGSGPWPKDIYGERGQNRPIVHVPSANPEADADRLLKPFLRRAFRRPLRSDEVGYYRSIVTSRMSVGAAFQDAMIAAYRAALSSPEFLFLQEPAGRLGDHALAQRLSYFLWSSMPDEALSALADRGELGKPEVLRAQVERMLNDPKGRRFIENFLGQWLNLREIGATQPDSKLYPEFMPYHQEAMLLESQAYFAELLKGDLGITRLVKSDFAMLNEPLSELYGVPGIHGWDLRKVALPPGHPRGGGFLTQGAVLKVTANGTTTSPVKRGAFVMEKIMGIVPTPPPPEAGAIEPDTRGAVTIRQQLDKHRSNPTCAGCHQKMDGYGFALESFDVMGERRDKYRATGGGVDKIVHGHKVSYHFGLPVDCTGTMPDGRAFKDAAELRELLAAQPERLAMALAGQFLVYATGGELNFADRAAVDQIVGRSASKDFGIRTMLHEIVQSDLFRTK